MTKLLSLFVAIIALLSTALCIQQKAVQHNMDLEWEEFKQAFDKVYNSPEHEREHQQEFLRRREEIRAHNAAFEKGHASYRVGFSHLTDSTPEEFQKMNGFRVSLDGMQHLLANGGGKFQQFSTKNINMGSLPDSVDWRTGGNGTNATSSIPLVTSVKNQYSCGSCWAFSTVGVLESAHARATGRLIDLSPQNLVDCDVTNAGCNGGFPMMALAFSIDEGGLNLERYYSYQGYRQQCKFNKQYPIAASMVNAVVPLPPGNEKALMAAVAMQGPISVAIEVTYNFQAYAGGVFVDRACSSKLGDLNHAVLVVGYGTDSKWGDYWIVKNSWGSYWGEDGYIRMARNRNNQCGIATQAVYAQIEN